MKLHKRVGYLTLSLFIVFIQILLNAKFVAGSGQDQSPVADFSCNYSTILKLGSVQFNDLSTGNPDTWKWILDGATPPVSFEQNPEVIYTQPGSFHVTQIVNNEWGTDTLFLHDFITVNAYPDDWNFSVSPSSHVISVTLASEPDFNGNILDPGDLVGVFFISGNDTLCGAFAEWTGVGNVGVVAFEDDPTSPEKDGFNVGEEFIWVAYSYSANSNFVGTATFSVGPSYFEINGLSVVSQLDFSGPTYWLISGTIATENETPVGNVFVSFGDDIGPVLTGTGGVYSRYVPENWTGPVSPNMAGLNFTPELRSYIHVAEQQPDQDFVATNTSVPPGWYFIESPIQHTILIPSEIIPLIYGEPVLPGDMIGVFYQNNQLQSCGGYVEWTGESDIQLFANGNTAEYGDKNGFNIGEEMIWRIYSWDTGLDSTAFVVYDTLFQDHDGTFVSSGSSAVTKIAVYNAIQHIIDIPMGWSGISSYVDPSDDLILNIFEPIQNELVIVIDQSNVYWPAQGINTIVNWDTYKGYLIKVEDTVQLILTGIEETYKTVDINTGWQLIPVLSDLVIPSADIFEPLGDTLIIAKDAVGGNIYWPALNVYTLDSLNPGRSYYLNVLNPCLITYPTQNLEPGPDKKQPILKIEWSEKQSQKKH